MADAFRFADDLGPEKVVEIYQPGLDLRAVLVIDNLACGPAIGAIRMAPDVSVEECFRLARAMTFKNAAAGLPHGGAKSVIFGDPGQPEANKEQLIRAFARAIRPLTDYIPAPDMGTDERCMGWIKDEIGRAAGLPTELGGLAIDQIGATGFGLAVCAEPAAEAAGIDLKGARVVIQGFGAVGRNAARFLAERGAVLVAAADSRGAVIDEAGIDIARLSALKAEGRSVRDYPSGEKADRDAVIDVECDIWIPAARPDVITADNVDRLHARLVIEGANIPITEDAEATLHARGVLVVPDFIANAGGVTCAAIEYRGGSQSEGYAAIAEKIRANTAAVLDAVKQGELPRQAALAIAERRVRSAMSYRRWRG
jgi:glutamate dehydrogenase (NAD(P)+)